MLSFSECLNNIKDRRSLTIAEMAKVCSMDKATMYQWMRGKTKPESWERVESIIRKLHVMPDEAEELRQCYEAALLGSPKYQNIQQIFSIFRAMTQKSKTYRVERDPVFVYRQMDVCPEVVQLNSNMEIFSHLGSVLSRLLSKKEQNLSIVLHSTHKEIMLLLEMFYRMTEQCRIEEIIAMSEASESAASYNLRMMEYITDILIQQNMVNVYCFTESEQQKKFEWNMILSDDFLLRYDFEAAHGMMTRNPEWIEFFRRQFQQQKKSCSMIGNTVSSVQDRVMRMDSPKLQRVRAIEYMPCLVGCLDEEILRRHLLKDLPGREQVINQTLQNFAGRFSNQDGDAAFRVDNYFVKTGLIEFMETGRLEVIPSHVCEPFDLKARCGMLKRAISLAESGFVHFRMEKDDEICTMENLNVEWCGEEDGTLTFYVHYCESKDSMFVIVDEDVKKQFKEFFDFLGDSRYFYSEEETVAHMKDILNVYGKKCEDES